MPKNPFQLAFPAAVQFFKSKKILPTNTWKDVAEQYQAIAFTIAGITKASLLSDIKSIIEKQLESGISPEQFRSTFREAMTRAGWNPEFTPYRVNLILSQNVRSAYGFGRFEQMRSPQVMKTRRLWQWSHRDSVQFRPNHKAIDGRVFPADHQFFQTAYPPCGFGCRCAVFALNERDLAREGLTVSEPPDPKTIADPGFKSFPPSLEDQRTQLLEDAKKRLPQNLARLLQEDAEFFEYSDPNQPRDGHGRFAKKNSSTTPKTKTPIDKGAPLHEAAISRGQQLIPPKTQKLLDDYNNAKERFYSAVLDVNDKKKEDITAEDIKNFKSEQEAYSKAETSAVKVMKQFRQQLINKSSLSQSDALELARQATIEDSALQIGTKAEYENHLTEFYKLTNGKGGSSIKKIVKQGDRASAYADAVNVGIDGAKNKTVLFHEFGHHIEFEDKNTVKAAKNWVKSRATDKPKSLNSLVKGGGFDKSEKAYPDFFVDPYVGKDYIQDATEVVSVGIQHFASPEQMLYLYRKDKEHFHLTLGLMR